MYKRLGRAPFERKRHPSLLPAGPCSNDKMGYGSAPPTAVGDVLSLNLPRTAGWDAPITEPLPRPRDFPLRPNQKPPPSMQAKALAGFTEGQVDWSALSAKLPTGKSAASVERRRVMFDKVRMRVLRPQSGQILPRMPQHILPSGAHAHVHVGGSTKSKPAV